MRRIGIEANGLRLEEYKRDLLSETITALEHEDEGKRNLVELAEFIKEFESTRSNAVLQDMYPELNSGYINSEAAIKMYRRFANEALHVFNRYPNVKAILT